MLNVHTDHNQSDEHRLNRVIELPLDHEHYMTLTHGCTLTESNQWWSVTKYCTSTHFLDVARKVQPVKHLYVLFQLSVMLMTLS